MKTINIAKDYSRYPGGRYRRDGKFNGEKFRQEILVPALSANEKIEVVLDGARSYGSSFLDEAFGGLVREEGYSKKELKRKLSIVSQDVVYLPYKLMAERYIDEA